MSTLVLKADKRKLLGRKVKQLRKDGVVPANVFGKKVKSESIQVNASDFEKIYKETGETTIMELQLAKDKRPVLVHNIQLDPVTDQLLHIDFLQVNLKEKVSAEIPVDLVGESPAEKQGLGTLVQYVDEVEVEALPTDLPEKFEIDVSGLTEVDQMIQVADLKYDKNKVEIQDEDERIVVKVEPLREEKEEEPVVEEIPEGAGAQEAEVKSGEEKEKGSAEEEKSEATSKE